ncbi:MAG TPA: DUF6515 family protein [Steroidobacteraceae bacterium]|jgi:hypothetical protein|nr:DUF6515 family protein [Steroidobacteraceae bacterium]
MNAARTKVTLMCGLLAVMLAGAAANLAFAQGPNDQRDHRAVERRGAEPRAARGPAGHQFFDNRYNHGRYYPPRGAVVRALPSGYRSFYYGGRPFFFVGGVWYASGPAGFIVTVPPRGLVVSVLPPFYTTVWLGGVPYYYADDVYYQWDSGASAYQVVAPPADADAPGQPVQTPPAQSPQGELFIYPKNGQTQDQQAQDRYECHSWATKQTGFDPTQPGGGVPADQSDSTRQQYRRAMTACLTARGYSVD